MTQLAIVDDHSIVLQGLELLLRGAPDVEIVGLYHNAAQLLDALQGGEPINTLLLDIHLPDTNGVELCRIVHQAYPAINILGLSMVNDLSMVRLMLKNGARGYLHKNAERAEVLEALKQLAAGKRYFSHEIAEKLLINEGEATAKNSQQSPFPRLSRREKEVLQLIVDEFTTQEIADKLFISFGTVETHRRNILSKLGARNAAGLVRIALEYDLLS